MTTPAAELERLMRPWMACDLCVMSAWRRNVVVGRGDLPAEVLLLGMAPGKSEDLLGRPFAGESGRWLRELVRAAGRRAGRVPSHYVANIVACRPCDAPHGDNRDPTPEEVLYCRPRLAQVISVVRPARVVGMGELAAREGAVLCPDIVHIVHPAYLARMGRAGRGARQAAVQTLAQVFKETI